MATPRDRTACCIALLGAESTGKTSLAQAVVERLRNRGHDAVAVPEALRAWCDTAGRTPRPHEQAGIAHRQAAQIAAMRQRHRIVVADTTAVMVAVYSELLFDDRSLYPFALAQQRSYDLTLVTGLDAPWVADGIQRDGPHVREPVDRLVRAALAGDGIAFSVLYGGIAERVDQVLWALDRIEPVAINSIASCAVLACENADFYRENGSETKQAMVCERCGDPGCERRLFRRLPPLG